ncbi:hypothetical protein EYF80_001154 [Liparis tanakae]|uniref:Uncharacterized protein n=1 Tax=Liparis tanakae TaxID=230148 RepID=A0A4Z2JGK4_9TELE|nr:hypothetical protein EYF80_001154 [Liparis tanakae]
MLHGRYANAAILVYIEAAERRQVKRALFIYRVDRHGSMSLNHEISGSGFPLAAHSMVAVLVLSTTFSWGPISMVGKPWGTWFSEKILLPISQSNSLHLPLITSLVPHYLHLVLTPFSPAAHSLISPSLFSSLTSTCPRDQALQRYQGWTPPPNHCTSQTEDAEASLWVWYNVTMLETNRFNEADTDPFNHSKPLPQGPR